MITNRAIESYTMGGGRRAALRLHTSLAILDRYSGLAFFDNYYLIFIFQSVIEKDYPML